MNLKKYDRPFLFYGLSTLVPWMFWFGAAFISHLPAQSKLTAAAQSALGVVGLASPMLIAFVMMWRRSELRADLLERLFSVRKVRLPYLLATCFLMLASILLAMAVSLLFGRSADQFRFAEHFSFYAGYFPAWFMLLLAPLLEELAWHSYGTDCLRARFSLFASSMMFAVFWALWHAPLSFIKDYYHSNLVETGLLYTLNFSFSLIPYVLIMNWLYYKTGRNILVAVVFHVTAGFFNEIFATHPDSKVIQTAILLILAVVLVFQDRNLFFSKAEDEEKVNSRAFHPRGAASAI